VQDWYKSKDDIETEKLLSLSGSVLLKVLGMQALISLKLVLGPGV